MDIEAQLYRLGQELEQYEDATDPEEKMDLKQTITQKITVLRTLANSMNADEKRETLAALDEFTEILSY